jgi:hypothetical protein
LQLVLVPTIEVTGRQRGNPALEREKMADGQPQLGERLGLALLICFHIVICCISLVCLAENNPPVAFDPVVFHLFFDPSRLPVAVAVIAAFALVSPVFVFARFSFGYFVGFYFYSMIAGYLWLNCFTDLNYDHRLAGLSAAVSAAAFLLSALFVSLPIPRVYVLSQRGFDRLLTLILVLAIGTIAAGATYNFRFVALTKIYDFRDALESPKILNYLVTIVSNALLPFAFAGFVARKAYWKAGAVLLLLLLFYPITLSKFPLFAPVWLLAILLISGVFQARTAVILSLLLPILAGVVLHIAFPWPTKLYFSTVNFRMMAIPSNAMDVYHDFFSRNDLTYFCQISTVRRFISCPYQEPLWTVMEKAYKLGNLNASLFATEGIASVGPLWAPLSAFVCGLVMAFANRMSDGLPPRFILISGAMLALVLLNVPLSIVLLTHGAGILFLLWYITPRSIFRQDDQTTASRAA